MKEKRCLTQLHEHHFCRQNHGFPGFAQRRRVGCVCFGEFAHGHALLDGEAEAVYALGNFFSAYDLSADDALGFFFDDEFDFDGFGAWEVICLWSCLLWLR